MTITTPPIVQATELLPDSQTVYEAKWYQGVKRDELFIKLLTTTLLGIGAVLIISH
jgi:hypothetical protein